MSKKTLNFYTTKGELGFCSNFYRAKILLDGKEWPTTEHYYQAQKMLNPEHQEWIRNSSSPKVAAHLGRTLPCREDWDQIKFDIMKKAVRAKFEQHPDLKEKLKATIPHILVEHTAGTRRPDSVWGDGVAGEGQNWLGKILMEIRDA